MDKKKDGAKDGVKFVFTDKDVENGKIGTWKCKQKLIYGNDIINVGDTFTAKDLFEKFPKAVSNAQSTGGAWELWVNSKVVIPIFPYPKPFCLG